jgi:hypothetical protein
MSTCSITPEPKWARVREIGLYGFVGRNDEEWGKSLFDPTWNDIEEALSRLNAHQFAGMVLVGFAHSDGPRRGASLHVCGGPKGYLVYWTGPNGCSSSMINPDVADSEELFGVCQRDQGVWISPREVCHDYGRVLAAARHFSETGLPWPEATWS